MSALIDYSYDEFLNMHYNLPMNDICNYGVNPALVDELQTAYSSLNENNTFTHFDFHPSIEELSALESLDIDSTVIDGKGTSVDSTPNLYYKYSSIYDLKNLYSGSKDYLESLSAKNKDISSVIANFITNTVSSVIDSFGSNSAIVSIRASTPNTEVFNPDWHTDDCSTGYNYAVVLALKGASTLFYNMSNDFRDEYVSRVEELNSVAYTNISLDKALNISNLFDYSEVSSSTKLGYGSAFLCGDNGSIHTAPGVYEDRLFIRIAPI